MHLFHRVGIALFLLIGLLTAGQSHAYADQVILTNGDRISGRLVGFSREVVRIETLSAGIIQLERKYVELISTDNPVVVDLVSGERIVGQIIAGEGRTVLIRSSILGERRLPIDNIDTIQTGRSMQSDASVELSRIAGKGTGASGVADSQTAKPAEAQKPKPIGQKPEDETDIRKIFLRQSTVLLHPGQIEVEAAPSYARTQSTSPILNVKLRQFRMPLSARIGLFDRGEGYLMVPSTYIHRELAFADNAIAHREFGIGDATVGLNYEIARETARRPDIIASVNMGAPTGSKPNEEGLSLGSGHWAAGIGIQFIKTVDPVALFGGVSYTHQLEARYFLNDAVHAVNPGEIAGYNFGFGFAVNENVSLSAQLSGSYQSRAKADGASLSGSSSEPVSLRSALTYRHSKGTYIEPSVVIGLDDDTSDFVLGISLTHRFGK